MPMTKHLFIFLLLSFSFPTIGQKLVLEMNEFEVVLEDSFSRRQKYHFIETLHYNKNLELDGSFTFHNYRTKQPLLKGKFRQNKLIDSLIGRNLYNENIAFKGFFKEETNNTDTFNLSLEFGGFTFLGSPTGLFYYYDYEGKLERTTDYTYGKDHYLQFHYNDKHISYLKEYLNGKLSYEVYFHDFDDSVVRADYHPKFKKEGEYEKFKQFGKIYSIKKYFRGKLNYESTFYSNGRSIDKYYDSFDERLLYCYEWYQNGQKKKTVSYDGELKNGFFKEYYENGQVERMGEYYCDSLEGKFIEYHKNGKISEEGSFHKGWIEKGFKKYDEKGKLLGSYSYNENSRYSGLSIIDGAYIKEDTIEILRTFPAIAPRFKDTIAYSKKEMRLFNKYPVIKIHGEIFKIRNENFKEFGLIYIDTNDVTIRKKDIAKLQLIINTHFCFISPFLVNNSPTRCRFNGIIKWNENE